MRIWKEKFKQKPGSYKEQESFHCTDVMDNSCLLRSLLPREHTAARRCELYIKYMMNAGRMKDNVFQMSSTKANMINVIDCAIIAVERLQ